MFVFIFTKKNKNGRFIISNSCNSGNSVNSGSNSGNSGSINIFYNFN